MLLKWLCKFIKTDEQLPKDLNKIDKKRRRLTVAVNGGGYNSLLTPKRTVLI
jgi:hypothetical protein